MKKGNFKQMPFRWQNRPPKFQQAMQGILSPFLWIFTLVYIDDIVVYSKSFTDHLKHVDLVLKAINTVWLNTGATQMSLRLSQHSGPRQYRIMTRAIYTPWKTQGNLGAWSPHRLQETQNLPGTSSVLLSIHTLLLLHSVDGVLFHACSWMDYGWFMTITPAVSHFFILYGIL